MAEDSMNLAKHEDVVSLARRVGGDVGSLENLETTTKEDIVVAINSLSYKLRQLEDSPLGLFSGGIQGLWYDPSDLRTLYQDSEGTNPVTKDGDPIGLIIDKTGNGNHAVQTVAASRPVYRTNGGDHWIEFDGVDDYFEVNESTGVIKNTSNFGIHLDVLMSGVPVSTVFQRIIYSTSSSIDSVQITHKTDRRIQFGYDTNPLVASNEALGGVRIVAQVSDNTLYVGNVKQSGVTVGKHTYTGDMTRIGTNGEKAATAFFEGNIYQLIAIQNGLSEADRSSLIARNI